MINRSFRGSSASRVLRIACLTSLAILASGCSSKGEKRDTPDNPFRPGTDAGSGGVPQTEAALKQEALKAYARAHNTLLNTDYEAAVDQFTQLIARYPFTEFATQSELEKVYAQYRSFRPDEALLGADRFLREAEPELRARVAQKTAWLWKKLGVDAAISDRIIEAAEQAPSEVAVPGFAMAARRVICPTDGPAPTKAIAPVPSPLSPNRLT